MHCRNKECARATQPTVELIPNRTRANFHGTTEVPAQVGRFGYRIMPIHLGPNIIPYCGILYASFDPKRLK